ncbi:acetyl-CoA carboxylase biotin carboxyl carrier protein subunit, partial [Streptosporangium vulgare]
LPFHRAVVSDPAFTGDPFTVHTRWIETEFDNTIPPHPGTGDAEVPEPREKVLIEVGGRRLEVVLPASFGPAAPAPAPRTPRRGGGMARQAPVGGDALVSSMQATVAMVARIDGDLVDTGDLVVVIEAMKMEQAITAHKPGMITNLGVTAGQTIAAGAVICEITDM